MPEIADKAYPAVVIKTPALLPDMTRNGFSLNVTKRNPMELLPPIQTMYRALCARDSSFEGIFIAGVRTTGIFCRPTCSAK